MKIMFLFIAFVFFESIEIVAYLYYDANNGLDQGSDYIISTNTGEKCGGECCCVFFLKKNINSSCSVCFMQASMPMA